jgi:HD-like signal output (HDOD) protein
MTTSAAGAPVATGAATQAVEDMLARLDTLPSNEPTLARVLQLVNDDNCSARTLGETVAMDPVLTIRLLRLANSAYYGLSGRIATPPVYVTERESGAGFAELAAHLLAAR